MRQALALIGANLNKGIKTQAQQQEQKSESIYDPPKNPFQIEDELD